MFDGAVEVGIQAFMHGDEDQDDESIVSRLEAQGVATWLAERLLVFLPIAFGRYLLRESAFDPNFIDGEVARPLDGDPVYRSAWARAHTAGRAEMQRIGLRSAAVDLANQLLHDGTSSLSDLVFTADLLSAPLPPLGPDGGGVPSPRDLFSKALAEHGFPVTETDGALHCGPLTIDARLFPRESPQGIIAQLDFEVSGPGLAAASVLESVAGYGQTWQEAISSAAAKFLRGSLHPLIAALIDRAGGGDQVHWERFEHPGSPFDLCIGPQLIYFSPNATIEAGPLLDALLHRLRAETLTQRIHWLRVFVSTDEGRIQVNEVLLDNEPWPAGEATVAAAPVGQEFCAMRTFAVLVPA
ncbi:DUF6348 family protein [Nocardia sp. NPDC052566]|uniref:DUF6348 family protein n=1 Tax=Nocardia sp. NPDC052566 TaxID=3364330 RepID=UPI0037C59BEC